MKKTIAKRLNTSLLAILFMFGISLTTVSVLTQKHAQAAFAGSNGKILYTKIDAINQYTSFYTIDNDGSNQSAISIPSFYPSTGRYSADGTKIVATGSTSYQDFGDAKSDIYIIDDNGTNLINVTQSANSLSYTNAMYGSFNNDASRIAFSGLENSEDEISNIYSIASNGTNSVQLTNAGTCDSYPVYSPDGNKIAFIRHDTTDQFTSIYIMNSDGSNQTEFVRIKSQDNSGCDNNDPMDIFTSLYSASIGNFTSIDWSPDGNTITYGTIDVIIDTETITTTRTIFSKTIGTAPQQILQTIDLYDKTKEQAGPEDQPENSNMTIISQPQFTPDGRIIYRQATISLEYTYDESEERWVDSEAVGTFSSAIKIMNADGSNPQTISSTSGVDMEGYMNMAFALQSPSMQPVEANDTNNNNGNDTTSTSTNVKELINPVTNKAVSLTTPENTNITCGQANKEDNLNTQDNDYQYPVGLIDFCFNTTESNNEVSLIFVTDLTPQQVKARKFNSNDNTYFDVQGTSITSVSYKGQNALKVNYNITDNGDLDLDSTTGKIKDPVGLAITNQLAGELSTTGANSALITAATAVTSAITLYGLRHRKTLYRSKN